MTQEALINTIIEGFDNPKALKALAILKEALWKETPTNPNNTNEYILIAGKGRLLRDIEIILENKDK